ncbi:uncharacterized protein [Mytilus edulis]|uniref:uncharacterized protein n=1 Tax=Mytilus edulis TaxID=6550 RepID=UPI0039EEAB0F
MNYDQYFKQLRITKQQQISTRHHLSNYCHYIDNNVIPSGLCIKALPQTTGNLSDTFLRRWDQTLFHCSLRLLILLREHCIEHLKNLTRQFDSLSQACKTDLTASEFENIQERLSDITNTKTATLRSRQRCKFQRDGTSFPSISTKEKKNNKTKNRHFRRRPQVLSNKINTVVNLSSKQLTEDETSLLSRGLNFCPVPGPVNDTKLSEELDYFARSLRIKEHFASKEDDSTTSDSDSDDSNEYRFRKKSNWVPKPSKNTTLESFIDNVKTDILTNVKINNQTYDNLTPDERVALTNLRDNDDIVIKPADKGSAVVVMDKSNYVQEAIRQLDDDRFYKKLNSDPTLQFSEEITECLKEMCDNNIIDIDTFKYLKPENSKPGRFYLLPKIHKPGNPGRPIVSANGHPTEKISEFVDYYLRPHVENLPSFIKDSTDYLLKMQDLNPLPANTTLVTMDVTSLYTNIPHADGIEACREVWDSRSPKIPPTDCLVEMLTMVLKKNNFTFQGEHYLQTNGTAMGTKMAPSYANIFMGKFEKQLLECSIEKPLSWYRFIDDVDMKWEKGDQKLETFITNANNQHPTIKFTHETSNSTINFLDTSSTLSVDSELDTTWNVESQTWNVSKNKEIWFDWQEFK